MSLEKISSDKAASISGTRPARAATGTVAASIVVTAATMTRPNSAKVRASGTPTSSSIAQAALWPNSAATKARPQCFSDRLSGACRRKRRLSSSIRVVAAIAPAAQIAAVTAGTQIEEAPATISARIRSGMPAPTRYWA